MSANRTIAIRLTLEEANQFQAAMKAAGTGGQSALQAISASADLTTASLGKVSSATSAFGKAANDSGGSIASLTSKLDAAKAGYLAMAAAAQQAAVAEAASASNRAAVAAAQAREGAGSFASASATYTARAGDLEAAFAAADKLRASLVPLAAAEQQHAAQLGRIAAAEKSGVITASEATAARLAAGKVFAGQTVALNDNAKAHHGVTEAGKLANYQLIEIAETAHRFADQVISGGSALKGLAYELPNAIGIAGGFKNAMAAIGTVLPYIGFGAAAAGLVALGVAGEKEEGRLRSLGQQARATRDDYGTYSKTLEDAARTLALNTTLSTKDARSTVNSIGLDANFAGSASDLKRLAIDAQDLATVLKTDLAGGTKVITDGLDNVTEAAKNLQQKGFAGFTPGLVRTIDLLQQSGRSGEAFSLFLQTLEARTKGAAIDALPPLEKALSDLRKGFDGTEESARKLAASTGGSFDQMAATGIEAVARLLTKVDQFELRMRNAATTAGTAIREAFSKPPQTEFDKVMPFRTSADRNTQYGPFAPPGMFPNGGAAASPTDPSSYAAMRDRLAKEYGVDPALIATLNRTEGHRGADGSWQTSSSGAIGGFQLLPGTFAEEQSKYGFPGKITDDEANARAGILYYREGLERRGGDPTRAYYDYHDGPAATRTSAAAREAGANFVGYTGPGLTGYADNGMVNTVRKDAEDLDKTLQGTRALASQALDAKLTDIQKQLQQFELSGRQDTPEYRGLLEREQTTKAAQYNLVDPQTAATRDTQRQIDTARLARRYGFTPADDQLAADMSRREDIARTTGSPVTDEVRGQVTSQFYAKANMELERLEKTQNEASKGQEALSGAYVKGNAAAADVTAKNEALHAIASLLPKDATNYADALQKLTVGYRQAITDAANIKVSQQLGTDRKDMATTAEEARLVRSGAGSDQTTIDLAGFKARQANDTASPMEQAAAEQSARDKAKQQLDLTNLKANANELTNFADSAADKIGSSLTSAFASGKSAAVSFGSITKSVLSELEQEFVKLAIINPLKDALFGSTSPNISSVGGLLGSFLGAGGSNAAATNAALAGMGGLDGPATQSAVSAAAAASGSGGLFSGVGSFLSGLFHTGGIVGSGEGSGSRQVPVSAYYDSPRYHLGGIAGDEQPAVLKVGEGVFTKGQMAALGMAAGGNNQAAGDTHFNFTVNAQGAGPREVDVLRSQIPLIAMQAVQSGMTRGGSFAKSVRGA